MHDSKTLIDNIFSETVPSQENCELHQNDVDFRNEAALQRTSKIAADTITSEPGYSNIDYDASSHLKKKLPYESNESSKNSKNNSMDWFKFGSGVSSLFINRSSVHCCPCLYCDKYNISKQNDNQTNVVTISDSAEEDVKKTTNRKCASKSICCLVLVLFLIFVSAGAILLYQSRK